MLRRITKKIRHIAAYTLAVGLMAFQGALPAGAEADLLYLLDQGVPYYIPGDSCGGIEAGLQPGTDVEPTEVQEENVKIIIGIAKTYNLGQQGARIGLMTAMVESNIRNLASEKVQESLSHPNRQGVVPGDHNSVGVFQQQVTTGWSTFGNGFSKEIVWQIMDVAYSAQAFFGTPPGAQLPANLKQPSALKKGVQNIEGWQTMDEGVVAQKVQISAFPERYAEKKEAAQALLDKYWESAPPIPLPIPIDGTAAGGTGGDVCNNPTSMGNMVQTAVKYSWPDYRDPDENASFARILKPDYATAVTAARAGCGSGGRCEYVGGNRYRAVDCGGFVTLVMRDSKADPTYNKYQSNVVSQKKYLDEQVAAGKYERITGQSDTKNLKPGDIWINNSASHTYMYVGKIPNFSRNSASASLDERAPMASNAYDFGENWYRLKGAGTVLPGPAASTGGSTSL